MGKLEASPWGTRQVVEGAMNRRLQHDAGMVASQESGNLEAIKWANGLSLGGRVMIPAAPHEVTPIHASPCAERRHAAVGRR